MKVTETTPLLERRFTVEIAETEARMMVDGLVGVSMHPHLLDLLTKLAVVLDSKP